MKYKALISFTGRVSMYEGEVAEISPSLAKNLLKVGYIKEVKEKGKKNERKNHKANDKA